MTGAFLFSGGFWLILIAVVVAVVLHALAWGLCRAAAFGDRHAEEWLWIEEPEWEPWPADGQVGTSWRS